MINVMHIPPLAGIPFHVRLELAGAKRVIQSGGAIYVSPELSEAMKRATPEELEELLGEFEVVDVGQIK